jgi:hypothetical protein
MMIMFLWRCNDLMAVDRRVFENLMRNQSILVLQMQIRGVWASTRGDLSNDSVRSTIKWVGKEWKSSKMGRPLLLFWIFLLWIFLNSLEFTERFCELSWNSQSGSVNCHGIHRAVLWIVVEFAEQKRSDTSRS